MASATFVFLDWSGMFRSIRRSLFSGQQTLFSGTTLTSELDEKAADRQKRRGRFLFRSFMNLPGSDETGGTRQKVLLK